MAVMLIIVSGPFFCFDVEGIMRQSGFDDEYVFVEVEKIIKERKKRLLTLCLLKYYLLLSNIKIKQSYLCFYLSHDFLFLKMFFFLLKKTRKCTPNSAVETYFFLTKTS